MTYLDYKYRVEFEKDEYDEIDRYCKEKGIKWFTSFDKPSVDFMKQYTQISLRFHSMLITDLDLCEYVKKT